MTLIGRQMEQSVFQSLLESPRAELMAVYGRRRVGKTHLIREFFKDRAVYFEVTGLKDGGLEEQLQVFRDAFQKRFYPTVPVEVPRNWREAFLLLTREVGQGSKEKIVLFFDELPWLATARSGLIQQLDHFWNTDWCQRKDLIVILCGSAASWMLDNLVHAKGGLHNRLTKTIRLMPFGLRETRDYLVAQGCSGHHRQVLDLYMVMGGVPYYLNEVKRGLSANLAINEICFKPEGLLYSEFGNVFASLFGRSPVYRQMVFKIAQHHYGLGREALFKQLKISTGGTAQNRLDELEEAGFVSRFVPYGRLQDVFYRVGDEYSLCYARWIYPLTKGLIAGDNYWLKKSLSPEWLAWAGYAFENICHKHLNQIARAIRADHCAFVAGTWKMTPPKGSKTGGAQIDLLLDRDDGVINLCEIKYAQKEIVIDGAFVRECQNKMRVFKEHTKTKKDLIFTLVTTFGAKTNSCKNALVGAEVVLENLFE